MLFFELISRWFYQLLIFAGYICGNNTFAPPLSEEEEKKYLELLKCGDQTARQVLIERNLRLVAHIAKKYSDENTLNDYISIGTIGLIKGIDTYNFEKKHKLSSYVSRCIENEILMTLRSNKKRQSDISIDEAIGYDKEGNTLSLADILPSESPDISDIICTDIEIVKLKKAIREALSPTEQFIICKRYGICNLEKSTQKEIAEELGISRSYVSRIEKKCLKELKNMLIKNTNI